MRPGASPTRIATRETPRSPRSGGPDEPAAPRARHAADELALSVYAVRCVRRWLRPRAHRAPKWPGISYFLRPSMRSTRIRAAQHVSHSLIFASHTRHARPYRFTRASSSGAATINRAFASCSAPARSSNPRSTVAITRKPAFAGTRTSRRFASSSRCSSQVPGVCLVISGFRCGMARFTAISKRAMYSWRRLRCAAGMTLERFRYDRGGGRRSHRLARARGFGSVSDVGRQIRAKIAAWALGTYWNGARERRRRSEPMSERTRRAPGMRR